MSTTDSYAKSLTRRWTAEELAAARAKARLLGLKSIRLCSVEREASLLCPDYDFHWNLETGVMINHGKATHFPGNKGRFRWEGCEEIAAALAEITEPLVVSKRWPNIPPSHRTQLEELLA